MIHNRRRKRTQRRRKKRRRRTLRLSVIASPTLAPQ
jgi:hypothetical protein